MTDFAATRDRLVRFANAVAGERRQLIAFVAVGFLNTIVGYGLFAALFLAIQSHRIAAVGSFIASMLFSFFSTGRLVFGSRGLSPLFPFVAGRLVILGGNLALLEVLVTIGIGALIAQALSLPPIVAASYLINSRMVFRAE